MHFSYTLPPPSQSTMPLYFTMLFLHFLFMYFLHRKAFCFYCVQQDYLNLSLHILNIIISESSPLHSTYHIYWYIISKKLLYELRFRKSICLTNSAIYFNVILTLVLPSKSVLKCVCVCVGGCVVLFYVVSNTRTILGLFLVVTCTA